MKKEINAMSDRELLMELVAGQRREEKWRAVRIGATLLVVLAIVILCAVYVPRLTQTVRRVNETMDQVQGVAAEAQKLFDDIQEIGTDKLAETIDTVNETASEAREIMDKLSAAGLDSLQQTIKDLSEFAETVKIFFGR